MAQLESLTIVLYDITHDRSRTKVSEKCLDFGMTRFQYSAFQGPLTRNRREELALVLEQLIEVHGGAVALIPVCQSDCAGRIDVFVEVPPVEEVPQLSLYREETDHDASADRSE